LVENDKGEPDSTCYDLLRAIEANCHGVDLTSWSWGRYSAHVSQLTSGPLLPRAIMAVLMALLTNSDKPNVCLSMGDLAGLSDYGAVKDDDQPFVEAAASVRGSVFVTTDGPLRRAVTGGGLHVKYGFSVIEPVDALKSANENQ